VDSNLTETLLGLALAIWAVRLHPPLPHTRLQRARGQEHTGGFEPDGGPAS
jgi:hypothetical protein